MAKILMINCHFQMSGGGDAVFRLEYEYLKKQGHDVYVYSWGSADENRPEDKIFIYPISRSPLLNKWAKFVGNRKMRVHFRRILANIAPDVIHIHLLDYTLAVLPEIHGYPVLLTMHGPNYFCANGWGCRRKDGSDCNWGIGWQCYRGGCVGLFGLFLHYLRLKRTRKYFRDISCFHSPTLHLERTIKGFGFNNTVYIPLGIDKVFEETLPGTYPRPRQILFAGALAECKGVIYLLQAFKKVLQKFPDATLIIAGRGPEYGRLQKYVATKPLGNHVRFLGYVDHDKIHELYKTSAVFVMPSIWKEQFGLVGPEALSCGTPCVGSNIGGIPEWLHDGEFGYLVPPRDPDMLAEKICDILDDSKTAEVMGSKGRTNSLSVYGPDRYLSAIETKLRDLAECD